MQKRSRLKNIVNKSKGFSAQSREPYDLFVESLPSELDYYKDGGKYRLKAAWNAYGKPKNYQEAVLNGLVETLDNKNFVLASIGYNKETDSYEYLNKGKENEIVNKDIRAWDNDVIPFIKELKQGGYIRTFDEGQDCWMYSKKEEIIKEEQVEQFKQGGQMNVIPEGALHAHKNHMELAEKGEITSKGIPVVSKEGGEVVQQAEVEREELTVTKDVTEKLESWYKKFFEEETTQKEKDEIAIKCGKFITKEILFNTDDRVGLIDKLQEEM